MNPSRYRKRLRLAAIVLALVAPAAAGCGSSNPLGGGSASGDLKSVVVGSADFPESKIIAEIYAQALEANGFNVGRQFGIGSRETYVPAVRDHSIDLVPEYTGNLLQYFDPKTTVTTPDAVELALARALPGDLSILTPSPANDTDTVAVTEATDGAPDSDLVVGNGTDSPALQSAILETTARATVRKAMIADKAMNAITNYIPS